jgi:hypothetical protein
LVRELDEAAKKRKKEVVREFPIPSSAVRSTKGKFLALEMA